MKKLCLLFLLLSFEMFYSQNEQYSEFYLLKKNYENYPENDEKAFRYLNKYIALGWKKKDYAHLVEGYKDAVFFSASAKNKLIYSDSTIDAALLSKDDNLISDAYLKKGIVYYFNYKKYKPALDEYLKAYQYSKNSKDDFLKNGILYHIGVVKSYLGYYDEALEHFEICKAYFEARMGEDHHPNIIFNNKKGYYNSLHRIIVCYRNLQQYKAVDSLIGTGILRTQNSKDYQQEYGYFLKEKGIEEFRKREYPQSINSLQNALKPIIHINDFAWATVDYFYIGRSYLEMKDSRNAIKYFQKVDSVFQKHRFILPELRENYELLISEYKKKNDNAKELYYTKQLLKADSVINKDFSYLSSTIHKNYDTKTLQEEKAKLELATSRGFWIIIVLVVFALVLFSMLLIRFRNEKKMRINYKILEQKILNKSLEEPAKHQTSELKDDDKTALNNDIVNDIIQKLKRFEERNGFTENGLTLNKLAAKFNTNSNYLSQVVNEYKGVNFNRYLSELRINFITNKLYNDKVYLNYKIETLAEKCGIASRTNFSNLFQEINGIRPTDFIKKRNQDIENSQVEFETSVAKILSK
nr:AraC family transcriptional regulator [uncultured Chryseobacterium sp.]